MKYIGLTISLQFKLNMTGASSKTLYIADLYKQTGQFIPGVLFPASVFIGTLSFAFVTRMHRQCVCNARMMFFYLRHNSFLRLCRVSHPRSRCLSIAKPARAPADDSAHHGTKAEILCLSQPTSLHR